MLAPIDLANPEKEFRDFLYPSKEDGTFKLKGVKSGKVWENGVVSFIGLEIDKNDIFKKIIDSGIVVPDVKELLLFLDTYVKYLKNLSLGTVFCIENEDESFKLKPMGRKPRIKKNHRLP